MMRRLSAALRGGEAGFTLVELVVSMMLIGVIFAIYSVTMSSTIKSSSDVQDNSVLQGEVRAAVEGIARDLRQTYTGTGNPGLETMTGQQIQFLSPDRQTPFHLRRITYRVQSQKLERAAATSTNTNLPPWTFPALSPYQTEVARVVNTNVFTYYDADGNVTSIASDVAAVTIKLVVSRPQTPTRQFTYATSVAMRVQQ